MIPIKSKSLRISQKQISYIWGKDFTYKYWNVDAKKITNQVLGGDLEDIISELLSSKVNMSETKS